MENLVEFAKKLGTLKRLKRTGWVKHNVPDPESVAEHSFRVAMLASIFAPQLGLDELVAIKMALIHDIGEAEIGDVITQIGKTVLPNHEDKIAQEKKAVATLSHLIDREDFLRLFNEFEENKTPIAQLVKELDKLEMAIQAYEYETEHDIDLQTFFDNTHTHIKSKDMLLILEEIEKLRRRSSE